MKNLLTLLFFTGIIAITSAQNSVKKTKYCEDASKHLKDKNPFYGFDADALSSEETIIDFNTQSEKLKISGTVFLADGITPAKDVIIFIQQADNMGEYVLMTDNEAAFIKNRLWVKTDENGTYTINTFIPGSTNKPLTYPHELQPMHIHAMIKEPGKQEYALDTFLFNNDPLVTKSCRKRLKRKNIDSILELQLDGDIQVVTKNIVLESSNSTI